MTTLRVTALIIFWGFVSMAYARSAEVAPKVDLVGGSAIGALQGD